MKDDKPSAMVSSYGATILGGMQSRSGRHVYEGTVPFATKQKRRIKNREARASRKTNRK